MTNGGGYKSEDLGETLCGLTFGVHLSLASETHKHLSGWSESLRGEVESFPGWACVPQMVEILHGR